MNSRDQLAALLGPQALVELDACVATAPPLTDTVRAELVAVLAELEPRTEPRAA